MTPRPLLLVSPAAGGAGDDAVAAVCALMPGVEVLRTADEATLAAALDAGRDRPLVVAGGDGSLHHVVNALRRRGELAAADLALVPLGTGNDLARTLGLPLDAEEAAVTARDGRPRRLDLLVDDAGGSVVNAVHLGVGAKAAEAAGAMKGALGPAAYAVGGLRAGLGDASWDVRVEVDGEVVHDGGALQVAVMNGRTVGGGTPLAPDADPSDGLLDVVVTTATGPLARVGYALDLRRGEHEERPDTVVARGTVVRVVAAEDVGVNADGELQALAAGEERTWRLEAGCWSLRT